ncbi:hypothetical protein G6L16_024755 (plasmid) [Agrobacterium tumefaciens]|nr:hypothetical protein [Agrobacterium tumefaciens]WIE41972.1 hypothetical protein G6L16_024755 [Agrobacterium tumefaciens]
MLIEKIAFHVEGEIVLKPSEWKILLGCNRRADSCRSIPMLACR